MSIVNPPAWVDCSAFPCERCGAKPGEPCVTIRSTFGTRYRGQGKPCAYFHAPRGYLAVAARRATRD